MASIVKNRYIIPTLCGMCGRYAICGINATVEDGRIVKVEGRQEHPLSKGFLCPVGQACLEYQYSPERLTYPMKKEGSEFKRISWDEALGIISQGLMETKDKYGAESLAIYLGQAMTPMVKHAKRFSDLFATPNLTSAASFCQWSAIIAHILTYGAFAFPDVANSKTILVWGSNPPRTNRLLARGIDEAIGRGAKLIVIDPRRTEIAEKAHLYVPIRPVSDGALALALLNVIITENLYEKSFVQEYAIGFDELKERVKDYSPEKVEEITRVPADTIRQIARLMHDNKPTCILAGIAANHATNGCQVFRAIASIIAISGNLDVPGGNIFGYRAPFTSYRVKEKFPTVKGVGVDEHFMFFRVLAEALASSLAEALITEKPYPIKAMLVQGGNPVSSWPNTNKTITALKGLNFLVVMDTFMTATAKLADVVLPAASFFERLEWVDYGQMMPTMPILMLQDKVVEPMGECWPDWKFWFELGRRLGYDEYYPWRDIEEAINYELAPAGVTVQQLRDNPAGIQYAPTASKKYETEGFSTPAKKVELYSQRLAELGHDPLPSYAESTETPVSRPDLLKEYPLLLTTGARVAVYQHSQFRQCPSLHEVAPEPRAEINSETAKSLGIQEGDMMHIETLRGAIDIKATVTDNIHPRAIEVQHGWAEANANFLTDNAQDPISGFPPYRASLCRVSKLS